MCLLIEDVTEEINQGDDHLLYNKDDHTSQTYVQNSYNIAEHKFCSARGQGQGRMTGGEPSSHQSPNAPITQAAQLPTG